MTALNDESKSLRGSKVLVMGIAYKPNVDDCRESPAAEVIELLLKNGAEVSYHDPHVPVFPKMRQHAIELKSLKITEKMLKDFDVVLIVTDHDAVDYAMIGKHARLIVDSRNAMGRVSGGAGGGEIKARVVKA